MAKLRYRLEKATDTKKATKFFLARSASFKSKHNKVRQYLGTTEPTAEDLAKAIRDYAYDLEMKAAEKVAEMAAEYYTADYLSLPVIRELERLRFLHNTYMSSLNKTEFEVYEQQQDSMYIHGTTAIEGNTLTLRETHYLINEGIVPKSKSLREINEVQNYLKVRAYSQQYKGRVTLKFVRELHSLIMDNIDLEMAGTFRKTDNVRIAGCELSVGLAATIELDLKDLINQYHENIKAKKHPFEQAILLHHRFEKIHPFMDGNGRTGREMLNYMLEKTGYPRLIIPKEAREAYLSAMDYGDQELLGKKGQTAEMVKIFAELMLTGYELELTDIKNVIIPRGKTKLEDFRE